MELIRIVLAEDHSLVREGTRRIIEQYPDLKVIGEANDGQEALELVEKLQPDIAILDIRMPKFSGIDVVRAIKERLLNTKTLILTSYDDDEYILSLMEIGASGYLLKTAREHNLIEAIRNIHQGESVIHPTIASKMVRLWRRQAMDSRREDAFQLSPREREILQLAAKGLRNKDIASQLSISVRTVEGHFNNILAKLRVTSRVEAIIYGVSIGLVTLKQGE